VNWNGFLTSSTSGHTCNAEPIGPQKTFC